LLVFATNVADGVAEVTQAIKSAFETDVGDGDVVFPSGLSSHQANQIVGDEVHIQFLSHHGGTLAGEHFHLQSGFEVIEAQFQVPAPKVSLEDLLGRIEFGIKQRGNQGDLADPKSRAPEAAAHNADSTLQGYSLPLFGRKECGTHATPPPIEQPIVASQPGFAFATVRLST